MRIIEASTEILTQANGMDFLQAIEVAGRTCYKSEDKLSYGSAIVFCERLIERGHEAMLEHAPSISVRFICDRGISHEIVRHRLFSFAQESTRYCNYGKENEITVILPCWFSEEDKKALLTSAEVSPWNGPIDRLYLHQYISDDGGVNAWIDSCLTAELQYMGMIHDYGWSPQQARSILPNSLKTEIIVTGNVREWRHFFSLRTSIAAHPQMRELALSLLEKFQAWIPVLFNNVLFGG